MRRSASWARGLRALRSALACAGPLASACTEIWEFDTPLEADAGFESAVDGGFARDGGPGAFFTCTFEKRVFRVAAAAGAAWSSAVLLTGASRFAYNDMPAMTFDGARVLFDCGDEAYPESGATSSCEVRLDGSALRVIATPTTIPANRNDFVQFPHDSVDGVLLQGAGDIEGTFPETIWLLPRAGGAPVPIGRALTNAVSPCALRDGRFGVLWLTRPDARRSKHELTLLRRDGTVEATLTPDVDVSDIGIGCGG